ncbi:MAG: hypothetical protein IJW59_05230 [Clostridia bacterium]|nr:hypothetical protein [Clostridia bacterium]
MKKALMVVILIVFSFVGFACDKNASISFVHGNFSINIGQTYTFDSDDVKISGSKSDFQVFVKNTDIAEVQGKTLVPKKEGVTVLRFQLKKNAEIYCDVELVVTNIIYATNAVAEKDNIKINLREDSTAINKIITNVGCNEIPSVRYNSEILTYDYQTGLITGISEGETNVLVIFDGVYASFKVVVIDIVYVTYMNVSDCTIFEGSSGKFDFSIVPYYANTFFFSTDSDILSVDKEGNYMAGSIGTATVVYSYQKGEGQEYIVGSFEVKITEAIDELDFDVYENDDSLATYCLFDKTYRLKITLPEGFGKDNLQFSSQNINGGNIVESDGIAYLDFTFVKKIKTTIKVSIIVGNLKLDFEKDYNVYSYDDIEIRANYFGMDNAPDSDGKFTISLSESSGYPKYIVFVAVLAKNRVKETLKVYNVTGGSSVLVGTKFQPDVVGEYTFEFEIGEYKYASIKVVVTE